MPKPNLVLLMTDQQAFASPNALFDLERDPEEEVNLYHARPDDSNVQAAYRRPLAGVIAELAGRLREQAAEIEDPLGCELADNCLVEMRHRRATAGA